MRPAVRHLQCLPRVHVYVCHKSACDVPTKQQFSTKLVAMRAPSGPSLAQLLNLPCSNHMLLHGPLSCREHTVAVYLQNFIRPVWHFLEADVLLGSQTLHRSTSRVS